MKQIPPALAVLRREIDRNPDDPGLYERLAVFLEQNQLGTQQEEVYRRAIARFPISRGTTSWRASICATNATPNSSNSRATR